MNRAERIQAIADLQQGIYLPQGIIRMIQEDYQVSPDQTVDIWNNKFTEQQRQEYRDAFVQGVRLKRSAQLSEMSFSTPFNVGTMQDSPAMEEQIHGAQQRIDPFEAPNESASAGQRELLNAEPTEHPGTWVKPDGGIIKTSKDEVEVVEPMINIARLVTIMNDL